jgi:hypothetical protein
MNCGRHWVQEWALLERGLPPSAFWSDGQTFCYCGFETIHYWMDLGGFSQDHGWDGNSIQKLTLLESKK